MAVSISLVFTKIATNSLTFCQKHSHFCAFFSIDYNIFFLQSKNEQQLLFEKDHHPPVDPCTKMLWERKSSLLSKQILKGNCQSFLFLQSILNRLCQAHLKCCKESESAFCLLSGILVTGNQTQQLGQILQETLSN